jgi:rhomboid family GlyGly-CTERM serine protease
MKIRPPRRVQRYAWTTLASLLAVLAMGSWMVQEHYPGPADLLAWHRASSALEIWRIWTSAGLHWSPWHLAANLLGCLVLAAWGRACDLGIRPTVAWLLAWPLTQASLWLTSDIHHYGGLSGVLHAGVAIGAAQLLTRPHRAERALGLWVLLGLCIKLLSETPILAPAELGAGEAVPLPGAPGYSVAYQVHWAGSLTGLLCTALVQPLGRRRSVAVPAPHGVISS